MRQMTLASQASFEKYARKSRREEFLSVMAVVVPWRDLEALIEPYYPKAGNGRQPVGLSIMLRVYFAAVVFALRFRRRRCPLRVSCVASFCGR